MAVTVVIQNHNNTRLTMQEVAAMKDLAFGIFDESYILQWGRVGSYTILFSEKAMGRGFELYFGENTVELRLPLPATPTDIRLFYELIEELGQRLDADVFQRDGEIIPLDQAGEFIPADKATSLDFLCKVTDEIGDMEYESFIILSALNPICMGRKEIRYVDRSLENFEKLLHTKQELNVAYVGPRLYERQDRSLVGLYFINEEVPSVVPKQPSVFRDDLEVQDFYAVIPGNHFIPYDIFIANVESEGEYDTNHIITSIDAEKVNFLAMNYGIDYETNQPAIYQPYYSMLLLDTEDYHTPKIERMGLDCDPLGGLNHIAAFLRWCYRKDLIDDHLFEMAPALKEAFDDPSQDIRKVLSEDPYLAGEIRLGYFKPSRQPFIRKVYRFNGGTEETFPYCVDLYAEEYWGTEKYNCEEFQDEAYMFVPYDEDYHRGLGAYIDNLWNIDSQDKTLLTVDATVKPN